MAGRPSRLPHLLVVWGRRIACPAYRSLKILLGSLSGQNKPCSVRGYRRSSHFPSQFRNTTRRFRGSTGLSGDLTRFSHDVTRSSGDSPHRPGDSPSQSRDHTPQLRDPTGPFRDSPRPLRALPLPFRQSTGFPRDFPRRFRRPNRRPCTRNCIFRLHSIRKLPLIAHFIEFKTVFPANFCQESS
jgi:hypothetical protein